MQTGKWNGFYNKSGFILFNMIFGVSKTTTHIDRVQQAQPSELLGVLKSIYYGAVHSQYPNAIQERYFEVQEPVNWGEMVTKVRNKLEKMQTHA